MIADGKIRKKLIDILKGVDYRKIVSERAGCHPNTVSNVLLNGNDNEAVELEIFILAKEIQDKRESRAKTIRDIAKQLLN